MRGSRERRSRGGEGVGEERRGREREGEGGRGKEREKRGEEGRRGGEGEGSSLCLHGSCSQIETSDGTSGGEGSREETRYFRPK